MERASLSTVQLAGLSFPSIVPRLIRDSVYIISRLDIRGIKKGKRQRNENGNGKGGETNQETFYLRHHQRLGCKTRVISEAELLA